MCKANERRQRRHRAMYFAPAAGQTQQAYGSDSDPIIPLLVEIPTEPILVSPPSSAEAANLNLTVARPEQPTTPRQRLLEALFSVYRWCVDVVLLVVVCLMGCFFYDVELKVVRSNRQHARRRGRSGRVVIQTNEQGITTSLLRPPPRSQRSGRSLSPRPGDMWDV